MCSCMPSRLHWPQSSIGSRMSTHGKLAKAEAFLVVPSAWLWAPRCWLGTSYCLGTNRRFAVFINQLCVLSWMVYVYLVIFPLFDSCRKFYTTSIIDFLWHNWWHRPLFLKLFRDNGEEVFCRSLLYLPQEMQPSTVPTMPLVHQLSTFDESYSGSAELCSSYG